jgi:hypothetical protein
MCAGEKIECHPDLPLAGFYRLRSRDKMTYMPVAYWYEIVADLAAGGEIVNERCKLVCLVNDREVEEISARERWAFACKNPITEAVYRAVIAGAPWPDTDQTFGDNRPPADDDPVAISEQIDSAAAGAKAYAEITDDETAARAQSLRSRLLELSGKADKIRTKQKAPHLEAGNDVDKVWQPIIKKAKEISDTIRASLGGWETKKLACERKAELVRLEAEKKAQEADITLPPLQVFTPPLPPPKIKGAYGRAAIVRLIRVVVEITDQAALYAHMAGRSEVIKLLGDLAQRDVDTGITVPGVRVEEQRKVT